MRYQHTKSCSVYRIFLIDMLKLNMKGRKISWNDKSLIMMGSFRWQIKICNYKLRLKWCSGTAFDCKHELNCFYFSSLILRTDWYIQLYTLRGCKIGRHRRQGRPPQNSCLCQMTSKKKVNGALNYFKFTFSQNVYVKIT